MFKLKRPCKSCPFKIGQGERYQLSKERLKEIFAASAFQCHATVHYDGDTVDEEGFTVPDSGDKPQQCAGLMTVLHREGIPNQIMQIAERVGFFDPSKLDPSNEVYGDIRAVFLAHCGIIED